MSKTFQGRSILPANLKGSAVVTRQGFNTLASFYKSILSQASEAVCNDQDNPELFGKLLSGRIICLPGGIGSTSTGATWDSVVHLGISPKAMLFSESIDSLSAAGLILGEVWAGHRICTVDRLGDQFLEYVRDDCQIEILENGTVIVDQ